MFIVSLLFLILPQEFERPLPDPKTFMEEFRKTLHSDTTLLRQYTYTEKETEITLDSKGKTKKTETNVYHVVNGAEEWQTYRRRIIKNGVPLTERELEKADREEQQRIDKETRKRASWSEAKRREEKAKAEKEEREDIEDVFGMYDFRLLRREAIGGASTILVTFNSKPNYKPKTSDGKMLQHLAGRAWIAEDDHELVKLEAEVIDPISIGAGLLAKLQKGSTLAFERRKINSEIWLPVREEILLNGRILLLKGLNFRAVVEYSDHKKYSVDTVIKFGGAPEN
jgi:hypothetical protein